MNGAIVLYALTEYRTGNESYLLRVSITIIAFSLVGIYTAIAPWASLVICTSLVLFSLFLNRSVRTVYVLIIVVPLAPQCLFIENRDISYFLVGIENIQVLPLYPLFIMLAGIAVILKNRARRYPLFFTEHHVLIPIFILLIFAFLTLFRVPDFLHSSLSYFILASHCLLLYILISTIRTADDLKNVMWVFVVTGFLQSVIGFVLYGMDEGIIDNVFDLGGGYSLRLWIYTGALQDGGLFRRLAAIQESHLTGIMLAAVFPMIIGLLTIEKSGLKRLFLFVTLLLVSSANIMTLSRGAVIGLFFAGSFTFLFLSKFRQKFFRYTILLGVGIVIMMITSNYLSNYLLEVDVESRYFAESAESGISTTGDNQNLPKVPSRLELWRNSFSDMLTTSLLGLGPGNQKLYQEAPHAHSIYFSFLIDFGLVGLVFIVWIGITLMFRIFSLPWEQSTSSQILGVTAMAGLTAVLVNGLIDFEYNTGAVWLFLGLAIAASNLLIRDDNDNRDYRLLSEKVYVVGEN